MFDVVIPLGKDHVDYDASVRSALCQDKLSCVYIVINGNFPESKISSLQELFTEEIETGKLNVIVDYSLSNGNQARNLGVAHGNSAWVAFLDSDDTWDQGWLRYVAAQISEKPAVEMLYGSIRRRTDTGREDVLRARDWKAYRTPEFYILSGGCTQSSAIVVRRELLGCVRWRPLVTRRQDRFFFMDIVRQGYVVAPIEEAFVNVHRDSNPRNFKEVDLIDFVLEVRGRVPMQTFLSFARGLFRKNLGRPLMLLKLAAGLVTLKHLDWYLHQGDGNSRFTQHWSTQAHDKPNG